MTDDELAVARAIEALDDSLQSTVEMCEQLDPRQWRLGTACPGWSVHDQVSHLAGTESSLVGRPRPAHQVPPLDHVVTDVDREIEIDVDVRRGRASTDVLDELREVAAQHIAQLRAQPPDPDTRLPFLGGKHLRALTVLTIRVLDVWTHGEDIRRAVGYEADDHSPAAEIATTQLLRGFAGVVQAAGAAEGSVVQLEITEPFAFTEVVAIDAEPTGAPTATLRMDVSTFNALSAGRIPPANADVEILGDQPLARAILAHMALTP